MSAMLELHEVHRIQLDERRERTVILLGTGIVSEREEEAVSFGAFDMHLGILSIRQLCNTNSTRTIFIIKVVLNYDLAEKVQ